MFIYSWIKYRIGNRFISVNYDCTFIVFYFGNLLFFIYIYEINIDLFLYKFIICNNKQLNYVDIKKLL